MRVELAGDTDVYHSYLLHPAIDLLLRVEAMPSYHLTKFGHVSYLLDRSYKHCSDK